MKMAPMNYGIKLNFPSKLPTANVNVLDNKVGTRRLQCLRSLPAPAPGPRPPPLRPHS